jgi:hypothetical protein
MKTFVRARYDACTAPKPRVSSFSCNATERRPPGFGCGALLRFIAARCSIKGTSRTLQNTVENSFPHVSVFGAGSRRTVVMGAARALHRRTHRSELKCRSRFDREQASTDSLRAKEDHSGADNANSLHSDSWRTGARRLKCSSIWRSTVTSRPPAAKAAACV